MSLYKLHLFSWFRLLTVQTPESFTNSRTTGRTSTSVGFQQNLITLNRSCALQSSHFIHIFSNYQMETTTWTIKWCCLCAQYLIMFILGFHKSDRFTFNGLIGLFFYVLAQIFSYDIDLSENPVALRHARIHTHSNVDAFWNAILQSSIQSKCNLHNKFWWMTWDCAMGMHVVFYRFGNCWTL